MSRHDGLYRGNIANENLQGGSYFIGGDQLLFRNMLLQASTMATTFIKLVVTSWSKRNRRCTAYRRMARELEDRILCIAPQRWKLAGLTLCMFSPSRPNVKGSTGEACPWNRRRPDIHQPNIGGSTW